MNGKRDRLLRGSGAEGAEYQDDGSDNDEMGFHGRSPFGQNQ
jgi:hypothetical protein